MLYAESFNYLPPNTIPIIIAVTVALIILLVTFSIGISLQTNNLGAGVFIGLCSSILVVVGAMSFTLPVEGQELIVGEAVESKDKNLPVIKFSTSNLDVLMNEESQVHKYENVVYIESEDMYILFLKNRSSGKITLYKAESEEVLSFIRNQGEVLMNNNFQVDVYTSNRGGVY